MEVFTFFIFNTFAKMLKNSFLLYHYGVWSVDFYKLLHFDP